MMYNFKNIKKIILRVPFFNLFFQRLLQFSLGEATPHRSHLAVLVKQPVLQDVIVSDKTLNLDLLVF